MNHNKDLMVDGLAKWRKAVFDANPQFATECQRHAAEVTAGSASTREKRKEELKHKVYMFEGCLEALPIILYGNEAFILVL